MSKGGLILMALALGLLVAQKGYPADAQSSLAGNVRSAFSTCDYIASSDVDNAMPAATRSATDNAIK